MSTAAEALWPLLWGDRPLDEWPAGPDGDASELPWSTFVEARVALAEGRVADAVATWRSIAARRDVEARHVLQAWTFLRDHGESPAPEEAAAALAVVVEVAVDAGHDTLAAYADGSVRYLNHAGGATVVDAPPPAVQAAAGPVLAAGQELAHRIGTWDEPALPALPPGHSRLVVLTPAGPRLGQGPDGALQQDPMAAGVFAAATALLVAVVELGSP